jgi:hypothetical protein
MTLQSPQVADGLFIGLLSDRAGVEDDDIRLCCLLGGRKPHGGKPRVHLEAVKVVHLAAIGEYLDATLHEPIHISFRIRRVKGCPQGYISSINVINEVPYCNL